MQIGPVTRRQASDDVLRPAGRSAQIAGGNDERLEFPCDYPGCDKSFGTNRGLGVHRRAKHPEFADQ